MGAVYRARQVRIDRRVAIKILPPPDDEEDPEFPARFLQEAKTLAMLSHPNIVTLFDFGEVAGQFYLVMEFVEGASLEARLQDGPIPSEEAVRIVTQVCDALQFAHDKGVVHRDIKPGNILLSADGTVKVADFGLAKVIDQTEVMNLSLTWINQPLGTPFYMSPEQRMDPLNIDHRADVYSLGVVLYELLTGRIPSGKFPPPSHYSKGNASLDATVMQALEFEPKDRLQSVAELRARLTAPSVAKPRPFPRLLLIASLLAVAAMVLYLAVLKPAPSTSSRFVNGSQPGKVIAFGTDIDQQVSLAVAALQGLENIVAIAVSDDPDEPFTLALTQEGRVIGTGGASLPPVPDDLQRVVAIAAGFSHAVALTADNAVHIWSHEGVQVIDDLPEIRQIAAAGDLTAALSREGKIDTWGTTQQGHGVVFEEDSDRYLVEIAVGWDAIIARDASGQVYVRGEAGSAIVRDYQPSNLVADTIAAGADYGIFMEGKSWLQGWGAGPIARDDIPEAPGGLTEIVSGPYTSAMRQRNGEWLAWGQLASLIPEQANSAISLDFGQHFGLALVLPDVDWQPPSMPAVLERVASFGAHEDTIQSLVADDERQMLWTLTDRHVRAFDLEDRAEVGPSFGGDVSLMSLAYSPTANQIAVGSHDASVVVLGSLEFPKVVATKTTSCDFPITAVAFSLDGKQLAAADADGALYVWKDGDAAEPSMYLRPHTGPLTSIVFDREGKTLYTTGWDRHVTKVTLKEDQQHLVEVLPSILEGNGHALAQQPGSDVLAVGSWPGSIYFYPEGSPDLTPGWQAHKEQWHRSARWLGRNVSTRVALAFGRNGEMIVSGGGDCHLRVWDAASHSLMASSESELSQPVHALAVTSENEIVSSGADFSLTLWRLPTK